MSQVCADAGGLPNLVLDGETGFLFRPGDTTDLVEKVCRVLANWTARLGLCQSAIADRILDAPLALAGEQPHR